MSTIPLAAPLSEHNPLIHDHNNNNSEKEDDKVRKNHSDVESGTLAATTTNSSQMSLTLAPRPSPSQPSHLVFSGHTAVSYLTLKEKLALLSGQSLWYLTDFPRLHLPSLLVSDGPHGVRKLTAGDSYLKDSYRATCFPPACALACSWNTQLCAAVGRALAREAWYYKISILLGPGLNLKRHAGGGRNFEYFSEDPLLSGRLAAAYVHGVQTPIPLPTQENDPHHESFRGHTSLSKLFGGKLGSSSRLKRTHSRARPDLLRQQSHSQSHSHAPQLTQEQSLNEDHTEYPHEHHHPSRPRFGHVGACAKHFCVNNQESHRFVVDAVVDERTARELYYRGFEYVVTGNHRAVPERFDDDDDDNNNGTRYASTKFQQPATIMCSYNKLNGHYCSEHKYIMTQLLRHEWNFRGVVMTDWGATNDRLAGILAGVDLEMPGSHGAHHRAIKEALAKDYDGTVKQCLDASAVRMLHLMATYRGAAYGGVGRAPATTALAAVLTTAAEHEDGDVNLAFPIDWDAHAVLARRAARDCIVLLQNRDQLLPLPQRSPDNGNNNHQDDIALAVIGAFARDSPRFQGMGSSQVHARQVLTAYDELQKFTDRVSYAPGYIVDEEVDVINQGLIDDALQVASQADVVVLFCGLDEISESEGFDRTDLGLSAQHIALIEQVCQNHNKVVVVLSNGGAITLPASCIDGAEAILEGYLLGQAGGGAVADVLFGVVSPTGKLSETMPIESTDALADKYFPGNRHVVEYREGLDVGYRYFDTANIPVRFPFGHGLSYTTFAYSNLQIRIITDTETVKKVEVSFDITNTGLMAGSEVAQCYIHDVEASVYRPTHELRDFSKLKLAPGERKTVVMILNENSFSFYDIGVRRWVVEPGAFEIQIGSSSRDIRLSERIILKEGKVASTLAQESYPPVENGTLTVVEDHTFAKRFGKETDKVMTLITKKKKVYPFNRNSLLKEIAKNRLLGKIFFFVVFSEASKEIKPGPGQERQKKMVRANVENLPLRALVLFSQGAITFYTLDACIALMNRKLFASFLGFFLALLIATVDIIKTMFKR